MKGEEYVIAYASKSLEGSEQHYWTTWKELLDVMRVVKNVLCYLYGQRVIVWTDNRTVRWLYRRKYPVGQLARWTEVIDTYDVPFQHRLGLKHGYAHGLLRYLCKQSRGEYVHVKANLV